MKVALFCTGKMELAALAPALKNLFPAHDFVANGAREAMPGMAAEPLPEFASARVNDKDALEPESVLRKYVIPRLAGALWQGYDHVVLLSDLELENMGRAPLVCDIVKHAIRLHLQTIDSRFADETKWKCRERVSFHLAVPMTEAWLFGDPAVCQKNKVQPGRMPLLTVGQDREAFLTSDPPYAADDGADCTALMERAARGVKRKRAPWITDRRTEHPKHYLQWLCREPSENDCTTWQETGSGAEALKQLDWQAVLRLPNEYAFLHALIEDLANALCEVEPNPPERRIDVPTRIRPNEGRTYLRNQ